MKSYCMILKIMTELRLCCFTCQILMTGPSGSNINLWDIIELQSVMRYKVEAETAVNPISKIPISLL